MLPSSHSAAIRTGHVPINSSPFALRYSVSGSHQWTQVADRRSSLGTSRRCSLVCAKAGPGQGQLAGRSSRPRGDLKCPRHLPSAAARCPGDAARLARAILARMADSWTQPVMALACSVEFRRVQRACASATSRPQNEQRQQAPERSGGGSGCMAASWPAASANCSAAEQLIGLWRGLSNFQLSLGIDQHRIRSTIPARVEAGLRVFLAADGRS